MDIVQHLKSVTQPKNTTQELRPRAEYKKNYEYSQMQRSMYRSNKKFTVVKKGNTDILFMREWTELNKYQKLNRIILFANKTGLPQADKDTLIKQFETRKIKDNMVKYDSKSGTVISIEK